MTHQVSAIIPVYNREALLGSAVASLLAQEGVDLEIVVVDDGSTDGSVALARTMQAAGVPIVLVEHETNRGVASARNSGLAAAGNSLILFLDSDDYLLPGALTNLLSTLLECPHRRVAYGWRREVQLPEARPLPQGAHLQHPGPIRKDPFVASSLVQRDLFEDIGGFDPALRSHEDLDWWTRIPDPKRRIGEFAGVTFHRGLGSDNLTLDLEGMRRSRLLWVRKRLQRTSS